MIPNNIDKNVYKDRITDRNNSNNLTEILIDLPDETYKILQEKASELNLTEEEVMYNFIIEGILLLQSKPDFIDQTVDKFILKHCKNQLESINYIVVDENHRQTQMCVNNMEKFNDSQRKQQYELQYSKGYLHGRKLGQNQVINNVL